jgi:hypothetical protein
LFLSVGAIFGVIGIVRGYQRELGVTTMLLITLFVITFTDEQLGERITALLLDAGLSESAITSLFSVFACSLLVLVTFISYEGVSLVFPGTGGKWFLSLLVGLTNGYLFAGSIWYYLSEADWILVQVLPDYSPLYEFLVNFLPPAIFGWPYFILLAVGMLLLRVVR